MELRDWAPYTQLVRTPHKAAEGRPALTEAAIRQRMPTKKMGKDETLGEDLGTGFSVEALAAWR